jgi:outer membrane lipoprotein-sorting protein
MYRPDDGMACIANEFKSRVHALKAALAVFLFMASFSASAAGWSIDELMSGLAQIKTAKAKFTEIKYISALDSPIESSGELLYTAPNKLEKRTLKPRPELMQIDGDMLLLERGKKKFTIQMQEMPELAALVESIRGTLAGDRKALEKNFVIGLKGTREKWTLSMKPNNARALQVIKVIEVSGSKTEIQEIEVMQADGDRSVMAMDKRQ